MFAYIYASFQFHVTYCLTVLFINTCTRAGCVGAESLFHYIQVSNSIRLKVTVLKFFIFKANILIFTFSLTQTFAKISHSRMLCIFRAGEVSSKPNTLTGNQDTHQVLSTALYAMA